MSDGRPYQCFQIQSCCGGGLQRVSKAKRTKDKGCYRTCLYISLSEEPPIVELPKNATNENFESFQQGKSPNRSIELAVRDYYLKSEGERYVWNQETIPPTEQNTFSLHPEDPQPVLDIIHDISRTICCTQIETKRICCITQRASTRNGRNTSRNYC